VFDGGNFKDTRRPLTKFLFDAISVASRECHVTQTLKKDGGGGGSSVAVHRGLLVAGLTRTTGTRKNRQHKKNVAWSNKTRFLA
jgi:hypothetical protein